MSHFYGEMQGGRAIVSRTGTKNSGFWAWLRGWKCGIHVDCFINEDGKDVCRARVSSGSGNGDNYSHHYDEKTGTLTVTED